MKKIIFIITILTIVAVPFMSMAALDFNLNDLLNNAATTPDITINTFDLSWSADTYTPLNYEGRSLPTIGSEVKVDATINASGGNAKDLKYSWFLEDIFQQNKSGYGKDSFSFYVRQIPGRYHTVKVQVFNEDRSIFEEKTIEIPVAMTEIVLSANTVNRNSIIAKPYFFSINKLTDLEFEWTIEGQEPIISSNYNASILDINVSNKNTNQTIEQQLWLNVRNLKETEQSANTSFKINI